MIKDDSYYRILGRILEKRLEEAVIESENNDIYEIIVIRVLENIITKAKRDRENQ
jgi:hypothetical protein